VTKRILKGSIPGLRTAALSLALGAMLGGAAAADPLKHKDVSADRYQIFLGEPRAGDTAEGIGAWRPIDRETRLLSGGQAGFDADSIGYGGPAGISYFTPRLSKMDLGIGLTGQTGQTGDGANGTSVLGGAAAGTAKWRLGGSVGTSSLRLGAAIGDHSDPSCREQETCLTNDFWDIGVAWRFGSGSLAAGYTASMRQAPGVPDRETLDIFSISAGYRIAPGLDVFGGIDWIELPVSEQTPDRPRNTRFMLGTNLRF